MKLLLGSLEVDDAVLDGNVGRHHFGVDPVQGLMDPLTPDCPVLRRPTPSP